MSDKFFYLIFFLAFFRTKNRIKYYFQEAPHHDITGIEILFVKTMLLALNIHILISIYQLTLQFF